MKQVLIIEASHNHQNNGSRHIAGLIEKRLRDKYPEDRFIHHDFAASPLPHLEAAAVQAYFTPPDSQSDAQKTAVKLSNELSAELLASDILVLSMPMWNFSVPATVKNWIDHVVRSGITFNYTQAGLQGFADKTRAIVVVSSAGVFSEGPMSAWDSLIPYVTQVLNFIGIKDIQIVRVEGTIQAPQEAIPNAEKAVHGLIL